MKRIVPLILCLLLFAGCHRQDAPPTSNPVTVIPTEPIPETTATLEIPTEQVPESTAVTELSTEATPTDSAMETPTEAPTEPQPERFLLTFAGDCTLGNSETAFNYPAGFVQTIGEDYGYPFRNVISYFENDELSIVNLECPLTDSGKPAAKKHTFRGPTRFVNILTQNSIEFVSLSNNHSGDYRQEGYDNTVTTLTEAGVSFVEKDKATIFTTPSGLTIGFYGALYTHLYTDKICAAITALDQNEEVDLVIFAAHWGIENTFQPSKIQQDLGHAAIDAGADIVYGTHPHVLQPIEYYNDGVIYYSLGNFTFGGNSDPKDYDTAIVQQEVIREPDGTVRLGELTIVPCRISTKNNLNDYQPIPYEEGSAEYDRVMEKLGGTYPIRHLS